MESGNPDDSPAGDAQAGGLRPFGLTSLQRKFADAWLANGKNGTQAAIIAGYSAHSAKSQASKNLGTKKVRDYLAHCEAELVEKAAKHMDADETLKRLAQEIRTAPSDTARVNAIKLQMQYLGLLVERTEDVTKRQQDIPALLRSLAATSPESALHLARALNVPWPLPDEEQNATQH